MNISAIPEDAPFNTEQRYWIAGFLAGLHTRGATDAAPANGGAAVRVLDIAYGTQTGNAEALAEEAAALAGTRGLAPKIHELDAIRMDALAAMETLIVVVSTYGEGEMPDNAHLFWEALSATTAPRLDTLSYGVLALGDTGYDAFCQAGKLIDTRLEQLGARRLGPRIDCDVDFEDPAAAWLDSTVPVNTDASAGEAPAPAESRASAPGWGRKNPFPATVLENRLLSRGNSAKEIRHFAFDLGDSGMTYEAGDALGVMPLNAGDLVALLLARLGASFGDAVAGHDAPLGELLTSRYEIMTPSRDLVRALGKRAAHDELRHVTGHGDKEALEAFLWGRDVLDLLHLDPALALDPAEFLGWLKPLQHRAYSISSSPNAVPGEVHLTVAAVRWLYGGRMHRGVASTFLADMTENGAKAGIFMSPNKNFRLPVDDSAPVIMVGPGTGIAPFMGFLQERRARGATGSNWLFFGDQRRECDFIYREEIGEMSGSGLLTRLDLAFSRDQDRKIYVQDRMRENARALFSTLEEGGCFYVCGDASRMAKDVDRTLHEIIAAEGAMGAEDAAAYVNRLKRGKRYLRDVY